MSTSCVSRNHSRGIAQRGESQLVASEQVPEYSLEAITRSLLPRESKTPRGAPPSRRLKRTMDKFRAGTDRSVEKMMQVLRFRAARGEPIESVTAGLYLMAAAVDPSPAHAHQLLDVSQAETQYDADEDVVQMALVSTMSASDAAAWKEAAARHVGAIMQMMRVCDAIIAEGGR